MFGTNRPGAENKYRETALLCVKAPERKIPMKGLPGTLTSFALSGKFARYYNHLSHNQQVMSPKKISSIIQALFLILAVTSASVRAQEPFVAVRLTPQNTDWDWEPYARQITSAFERALARRVREGLPRREFELSEETVRLKYFFRLDLDGNFRRFAPLSPEHRYHSYLIRRTARDIPSPPPLPASFQGFVFDGELTFELGFNPTGRYKRYYFEEPIDSLELPDIKLPIVTRIVENLFLYEPPDMDKNKLLDDYRRRIGIPASITDTSSYTPLDFSGIYLALSLPYDSLFFGMQDTSALRDSLAAALKREGARVLAEIPEFTAVAPNITEEDENTDSLEQTDTTLAAQAKPDGPDDTPIDTLLPAHELPVLFRKAVDSGRAYVLSAALARDTVPNRALCRLSFYEAERPDDLKRRVDYRFPLTDALPDTLGRALVNRLAHPPEKPKPPAPSTPAAPPVTVSDPTVSPAPADSAGVAGADSSLADPAAVQEGTAQESSAAPADTVSGEEQPQTPLSPDTVAPAEPESPASPGADTPEAEEEPAPPLEDTPPSDQPPADPGTDTGTPGNP